MGAGESKLPRGIDGGEKGPSVGLSIFRSTDMAKVSRLVINVLGRDDQEICKIFHFCSTLAQNSSTACRSQFQRSFSGRDAAKFRAQII